MTGDAYGDVGGEGADDGEGGLEGRQHPVPHQAHHVHELAVLLPHQLPYPQQCTPAAHIANKF